MRLLICLLLLTVIFAGCDRRPVREDLPHSEGNSVDHSRTHHEAMESSPNAASAPFELQFLDTMIVHHEGAIDMGQLVQTRASHEELKVLARKIVAEQQQEITQMRALREKFFISSPPAVNMDLPGMRDGMQGMDLEKLDALKENLFDLEFIRQMIPHHNGAIEMAQDALARPTSKDAELAVALRQLSQTIVSSQTAEIRQMQQWEAAWAK